MVAYLLFYALVLGAVWIVLLSPGPALARALGGGATTPPDPLAILPLATAFWIAVGFTACAAGFLQPFLLPIVGVATAGSLWLARSKTKRPVQVEDGPRPGAARLIRLAVWVSLAALFTASASTLMGWDDATYHLTLPRLYVEHGGFRDVPFNVYADWPHAIELLYALAMLSGDYVAAKLVAFSFLLMTLWAITAHCGGKSAPLISAVAAGLFLANPVVIRTAAFAYVDVAFAFFLLGAVHWVSRAADDSSGRRRHLLLAGVCCGMLAGVKAFGIVGLPIALTLFAVETRWQGAVGPRVRDALTYLVAPAAVLALPWLLKTLWYTGNPVYPFFHELFGGEEWNAELGEQLAAWHREIGMGRSLWDYLMLPLRVILFGGYDYEHFGGRVSLVWLALIPLAAWRALHDPAVRRPLAAAALYFVFWSLSSQQTRFLIPTLPLLGIAAAISLAGLANRRRAARAVRGGLAVAISLLVLANAWPQLSAVPEHLRVYALPTEVVRERVVHPVFRFVRTLPADARLLFLNTNHGFFCERDYIADSFFQASQIHATLARANTAGELRELLRSIGITHVLRFDRDWGIAYPPTLDKLLVEHGQRVFGDDDSRYEVFALD